MLAILVAAFVAAGVTAFLTPSVRNWSLKMGAVDQPGGRRINTSPIPRAGGIAIYFGFVIAVLITVTWRDQHAGHNAWSSQIAGILLATTFIAITGLIDDFKDVSAKWQALAIIVCALILIKFGVRIEGITNPLGGTFGSNYNPNLNWHGIGFAASVVITIIWVFIVTKTVDAIDGVDGLAAGVCAISAATLALMSVQLPQHTGGRTLALVSAAIVGSCLGFLRHNYHPAKIIMGTIGAQVLGLALAAVSILGAFKAAAAVSVLVPVIVLGVPIFDFTHVLARRFIARAPLTMADKRHLHHRLLARGWNQKQVVWFIYSVAILLSITALALFHAGKLSH